MNRKSRGAKRPGCISPLEIHLIAIPRRVVRVGMVVPKTIVSWIIAIAHVTGAGFAGILTPHNITTIKSLYHMRTHVTVRSQTL